MLFLSHDIFGHTLQMLGTFSTQFNIENELSY